MVSRKIFSRAAIKSGRRTLCFASNTLSTTPCNPSSTRASHTCPRPASCVCAASVFGRRSSLRSLAADIAIRRCDETWSPSSSISLRSLSWPDVSKGPELRYVSSEAHREAAGHHSLVIDSLCGAQDYLAQSAAHMRGPQISITLPCAHKAIDDRI
jgi:hypothetical protein